MPFSEQTLSTETFALYLAVELLGASKVIKHLNDEKRRAGPAVPLYWRSKLMIPELSRLLHHAPGKKDSGNFSFTKLLFFDVTFNFENQVNYRKQEDINRDILSINCTTSRTEVSISLGLFFLLQKGGKAPLEIHKDVEISCGHYISTRALEYDQIMSHVESLQLNPQSVTEEALASAMAKEFRRQGFPSTITAPEEGDRNLEILQRAKGENDFLTANYVIKNNCRTAIENEENEEMNKKESLGQNISFDDSSSNYDISIVIPYKSMGNLSGRLLLKCSCDDVTKFSRSTLRFLSWDFSTNANNFGNNFKIDESLSSKKEKVDHAFDRWRAYPKGGTSRDDNKVPGNGTFDNSNNAVILTTDINSDATKTNDKRKTRKHLKGIGILPSARKKRNKGLVYDC